MSSLEGISDTLSKKLFSKLLRLKSHPRVLSCVDGFVHARFFSTDVDRYEERSCVRPVGAVYITAGLDEVCVPGP